MPHLTTITLPDGITYDIDTQYTAGDGLVINGQDNEISVLYGSTANTACEGDDPRLSDARNAKDVYSWAKEPLKPTYTSSEVGAIDSTLKGSVNGVAELDENGLVPSSQLPSYVDDVVEGYYYNNNFYKESTHETLIVGESGKIYLDLTENITYRWGGSSWVKMSSPLALGETSSTAYRGDRGKYAYDHASDSGRLTTATNLGMYKISSTAEGHIASLSPITTQDLDQKLYQWVTQAEYDALTTEEQMNGTHYLIDAPSTTDNLLWAKVGHDVLTTTAQDLSAAINEHEEDITQLNSSLTSKVTLKEFYSTNVTLYTDTDYTDYHYIFTQTYTSTPRVVLDILTNTAIRNNIPIAVIQALSMTSVIVRVWKQVGVTNTSQHNVMANPQLNIAVFGN